MIKGLAAGAVNLALAVVGRRAAAAAAAIGGAALIGFFGYGVSLVLFVLALRHLGAARTGAYFSTAPFLGAVLAVAHARRAGHAGSSRVAGVLMAVGVALHLAERHEHEHAHEALEHEHRHVHDAHHRHAHRPGDPEGEPHTHPHRHPPLVHKHPHYPDLHHRHDATRTEGAAMPDITPGMITPKNVAVGVGTDGVPVFRRRRLLALGRSVRGRRHRFDLADRPAGQPAPLSRMHERDGGAGRAHEAHQVRRQRAVAGDARRGAGGAAMRDDRFSVERAPVAGLRHRQPLGAGMEDPQPRPEDPRPQDRRGARGDPPAVVARTRSISRACTITCRAPRSRRSRCSPICRCGSAARPRRRSGAPRGSAPAGRPGRRPRSRPRRWSRRSSAAAAEEGRTIDDDHYGAGIPYRFGSPDDPALRAAVRGLQEAHRPRP